MMKHQVVWAKCSVTNKESGKDLVVPRGEMLPDWVDEFTLFVLTGCGAVKAVEQADAALVAEGNPPEPVRLQEHAPEPESLTAKPTAKPAVVKNGK